MPTGVRGSGGPSGRPPRIAFCRLIASVAALFASALSKVGRMLVVAFEAISFGCLFGGCCLMLGECFAAGWADCAEVVWIVYPAEPGLEVCSNSAAVIVQCGPRGWHWGWPRSRDSALLSGPATL